MQTQLFRHLLAFSGFMLLVISQLQASKVRGTVTDENAKPLPFATVYVEGTTNGTTTNDAGQYQLEVSEGNVQIVFRFLGYQTKIVPFTIKDGENTLNVQLELQPLQLREVSVSAKDEDPAYTIIRNAQAKRKYYLTQVEKFDCQAYVKSVIKIENAPKSILGKTIPWQGLDKNGNGILYLSESVARYYYMAPDKDKEVMISSKVSGNNMGFSWNSARISRANLYTPSMSMSTEREIISPIAPTAMLHYRYKLIGEYQDKGVTVNKIQVIPRVSGSPTYKGYIHIQENTWRIHSADLYITKEQGTEFLDTLRMRTIYVPVTDSVWLMSSQVFDFRFSAGVAFAKFKGNGSFVGNFSKYNLDPKFYISKNQSNDKQSKTPNTSNKTNTTAATKNTTKTEKKALKQQQKQEAKALKEFFNKEVTVVEAKANKRTESYWDSIRPVPLTEAETRDYVLKDSIRIAKASESYQDSIDRISNKFKPINLLTGYTYQRSYHKQRWAISSPLASVQFNTVEGYLLSQTLSYNKRNDTTFTFTNAETTLRYGFASKTFYYKGKLEHRFNALSYNTISVEGGRYIFQINPIEPITPTINSLYSLVYEQNFMKLYEKTYAKIFWGREIANGLMMNLTAEFAQRTPLQNANPLLKPLVERDNREFTSNNPLAPDQNTPVFEQHNALISTLAVRYRPFQEYITRPNMKANLRSPYPTLTLVYDKAWAITDRSPDFDRLRLSVYDDRVNIGIVGSSAYDLTLGGFISKRQVPFLDFRHFNTSQTLFGNQAFRSFWLLPYYQYSTTDLFAEGHFEHHFNGFLTSSIPYFKKLNWYLIGSVHALYTDRSKEYIEASIGLENIFKFLRMDYVISFQEGKIGTTGIRLKVNVPN